MFLFLLFKPSELQGALASKEAELQELRVQLENQGGVQVSESSEVEQLKTWYEFILHGHFNTV